MGSDAQVIRKELPSDDPRQRQPDISKAKELLDWQPTVELQQGLQSTIAYFSDILNK